MPLQLSSHSDARSRRERRRARTRIRTTVVAVVALVVSLVALTAAGAVPGSAPYQASVDDTVADIQGYWSRTLPDVYGVQYDAIPPDRLFPYSEASPPPNCEDGGRTRVPYEDIAGNAFYCSNGDFVGWDEQELFPELRSQFGEFAIGLVLAHEWGHAIQARTNNGLTATVYVELQADCFAGAWTRHVADGDQTQLTLSTSDLDNALAGYLELRDPVGVDASQDGAHGNAFDRVGAFQDGYDRGATACRDFESTPPTVTETGFTDSGDAASAGNLPEGEIEALVQRDLDAHWSGALNGFDPVEIVAASGSAPCASGSDGGVLADGVTYCGATNTISYDPVALSAEYQTVGDFGVATLLAAEWSSAVQHQLGQSLDSEPTRSTAYCLTGAWAGSVAQAGFNSSHELTLSPGDLDEAIQSFVVGARGATPRGTAFARVQAFRTGFLHGPDACT